MATTRVETQRRTLLGYGLLALAFSFYLGSVLLRIGHPVSEDELNWLVAARSLYLTGRPALYAHPEGLALHSPHVYLASLKLAFDLFGIHDAVARIPGILSGLLALVLVFVMTRSFIPGEKEKRLGWAALTTLLYATTPAFIQGSLILENDNTLLIPAILFLVFSFLKYLKEGKILWALATGLAAGLALGVRVTTPAIVIFLLGVYALAAQSPLRSKLTILGMMGVGILVFFLLWFAYCQWKDFSFSVPFRYTLNAFHYRTSEAGGLRLSALLPNLLYLTLWIGLFPALLFLVLALRRGIHFLRRFLLSEETLLLILGLTLVGGYTLVGGTPFGFPKYHSPGIALMVVFSGIALPQILKADFPPFRLREAGLVVLAAFLIQIFTVSDLLYFFRYQLREAAAFESSAVYSALLKGMAFKTILYALLFAVLFFVCVKRFHLRQPSWALILFALGSNMAACYLQNTKGYQTGYDYGIRGTIKAAQFIEARVTTQDSVIARGEINYYLSRLPMWGLVDQIWNDEQDLTRFVQDPHTGAFAYSVGTNPVGQIQKFSRYEPLQRLLRQEFDPYTIESFKIWIRKK